MAGASFTFAIDDRQVRSALTRLGQLGERPERLMRILGTGLVTSTKRRFDTNIGPDGASWQALSPAYAEIRRPGPILVQSGDLRDFIHYEAAGRTVRVGSSMIYAGVHQFGATIKPKTAQALVFRYGAGGGIVRLKSVRIPARPFLGISAEDAERIVEDTLKFVERVFNA
jgi:phage virion morphogenesis protein